MRLVGIKASGRPGLAIAIAIVVVVLVVMSVGPEALIAIIGIVVSVIVVLSVWGQEIYFFCVFLFYA